MRRPTRDCIVCLIAALTCGCAHLKVIVTATRHDLGPHWLTLTATKPLKVPGPYSDLCLSIPKTYRLGDGSSHSGVHARDIQAPDGVRITVRAVLVTPDGRRDELPNNGFAFSGTQAICFTARLPVDPQRVYAQVELWASSNLPVDEVTWESGDRRPVL